MASRPPKRHRYGSEEAHPTKRCRYDSDSPEPSPPRVRVPLLPPTISASVVNDPLDKAEDAIAALTPELQTKLLEKLFADPALAPAVTRAMNAMYPDAVPALAASIRARFAAALAPIQARTANGNGDDFSDLTDYVGAAQTLLPDVARLARIPSPGAAAAAYAVLIELVSATTPEEDCTIDAVHERVPFDVVVDEMLMAITQKLKAEEGAAFVVGKELQTLEETADNLDWGYRLKGSFPKSIALLKEYAAETS